MLLSHTYLALHSPLSLKSMPNSVMECVGIRLAGACVLSIYGQQQSLGVVRVSQIKRKESEKVWISR